MNLKYIVGALIVFFAGAIYGYITAQLRSDEERRTIRKSVKGFMYSINLFKRPNDKIIHAVFLGIEGEDDPDPRAKRFFPPLHAGGARRLHDDWGERSVKENLTPAQAWEIAITEDTQIIAPNGKALEGEVLRQTKERFMQGVRRAKAAYKSTHQ